MHWRTKNVLFAKHKLRARTGDIRAVKLTEKNLDRVLEVVEGTVIETKDVHVVIFESLMGRETLVIGEWLVWVRMPYGSFFLAMNQEALDNFYEEI